MTPEKNKGVKEMISRLEIKFYETTENYCLAYQTSFSLINQLEELIGLNEMEPGKINDITEKLVFAEQNLRAEEERRDVKARNYINALNYYTKDISKDFEKTHEQYKELKEVHNIAIDSVLNKLKNVSEKNEKILKYSVLFERIDPIGFKADVDWFNQEKEKEEQEKIRKFMEKTKETVDEDVDKAYR